MSTKRSHILKQTCSWNLMVGIAIYKLCFYCGLLKKQNLETFIIKTDTKSLKKWRPIILRLSENFNIKYHNIMNSEKTNWILIENIAVEVRNTASISKDIMFHVSKFLQKMFFQLMFEIIKWIRQLQVRRQSVPNYWRQKR